MTTNNTKRFLLLKILQDYGAHRFFEGVARKEHNASKERFFNTKALQDHKNFVDALNKILPTNGDPSCTNSQTD